MHRPLGPSLICFFVSSFFLFNEINPSRNLSSTALNPSSSISISHPPPQSLIQYLNSKRALFLIWGPSIEVRGDRHEDDVRDPRGNKRAHVAFNREGGTHREKQDIRHPQRQPDTNV